MPQNDRQKIFVVIPAYNEQNTIADIAQRCIDQQLQVIVVDDGSTDKTLKHLQDLKVRIVRNKLNQGKAVSLLRGMTLAIDLCAEYIITLDGDGQHQPEDIPQFINAVSRYPNTSVLRQI